MLIYLRRVYFFVSIQGLVKVIKEFKYSHGTGWLSSHKCDKIKDLGPEMKNRQPWMETKKYTTEDVM